MSPIIVLFSANIKRLFTQSRLESGKNTDLLKAEAKDCKKTGIVVEFHSKLAC
jgi:hypothetical protein